VHMQFDQQLQSINLLYQFAFYFTTPLNDMHVNTTKYCKSLYLIEVVCDFVIFNIYLSS